MNPPLKLIAELLRLLLSSSIARISSYSVSVQILFHKPVRHLFLDLDMSENSLFTCFYDYQVILHNLTSYFQYDHRMT